MFKLICDTRERQSTLPLFPKHESIIESQLVVGDYAITYNDQLLFIFERKTWGDLSASIKDGRLLSQVNKMMNVQCRRMIIIEGKLGFEPETEIEGIPYSKLDAMRRRLIIQGFEIIQCANPSETVKFLLEFYNQFIRYMTEEPEINKLYMDEPPPQIVGGGELPTDVPEHKKGWNKRGGKFKTDTVGVLTERRELSDEELVTKIWLAFPKIGETMIDSMKKYSLVQLTQLTHEQLANILNKNGRKFGKAGATSIINVLNGGTGAAKIMSEFPGISKKSADYICCKGSSNGAGAGNGAGITLAQFLTNDMRSTMKSDKSGIGPKCAERIRLLASLSFN